MGGIWLYDLPDVLAGAGLAVEVWPGWENRSRGSGGYDAVRAVFAHHTASNTSPDGDRSYMWDASGGDQPIGALYLARDGVITVGAAGATNCQGKGGPWDLSTGTIPKDCGNAYGIALEAANTGTGEPWPAPQCDAYVIACRALCDAYGLSYGDVLAHFEWVAPSCPGRKIDPAGPSPWAAGAASWDMGGFRAAVAGAPVPVPPEPEPVPPDPPPDPTPAPPDPSGDFMADLPTIRYGDSGDYVERMQHLLAAAGYMNPANTANYDGVWGNGTEGAKVQFDADHGLTPSPPTDCGPKSWESLITGRRW